MATTNTDTEHASIDDVDFSGISRIRVRDLTHPQNGWQLTANGVSVWCEVTLDGDEETLEVFITDQPNR
jgi:hypothetical protein